MAGRFMHRSGLCFRYTNPEWSIQVPAEAVVRPLRRGRGGVSGGGGGGGGDGSETYGGMPLGCRNSLRGQRCRPRRAALPFHYLFCEHRIGTVPGGVCFFLCPSGREMLKSLRFSHGNRGAFRTVAPLVEEEENAGVLSWNWCSRRSSASNA